jgi:AraC-like DNA-binding protein
MKTAIHQISDCPFKSPHLILFQESKALELVAWHLEIMSTRLCQNANRCSCCRLKSEDIQRIQAAREILIRDFDAPPCLKILAARVGLNVTKLKRGFRQLYGDSVFAYLREYRMEVARQALEKGEMNVTEVAMSVGYTNIGHFCAIFKKHFGINPGCCLRQTMAPQG